MYLHLYALSRGRCCAPALKVASSQSKDRSVKTPLYPCEHPKSLLKTTTMAPQKAIRLDQQPTPLGSRTVDTKEAAKIKGLL